MKTRGGQCRRVQKIKLSRLHTQQVDQCTNAQIPWAAELLNAPVRRVSDQIIFADAIRLSHLCTERAVDAETNVPCALTIQHVAHSRLVGPSLRWHHALAMHVQLLRHANRNACKEPRPILFVPLDGLVVQGKKQKALHNFRRFVSSTEHIKRALDGSTLAWHVQIGTSQIKLGCHRTHARKQERRAGAHRGGRVPFRVQQVDVERTVMEENAKEL